jgi:PAS domain S-box-containing protein
VNPGAALAFHDSLAVVQQRVDLALEEVAADELDLGRCTEALQAAAVALSELEVASEEIEEQQRELAHTRRLLEEERTRYEEHFRAAPEAYLVTTPDALIQEANRAAVDLLGVERRYLLGKPMVVFIRRPHQPAHFAGLAEARRSGATRWETVLSPRHRDPLPVEVSVSVGAGGSYRWIIRDMTLRVAAENRLREALNREQRVADDLRRLDRLKSDFLLVVTHSLRTPVASILRTAELLDSSASLDEVGVKRALGIINEAALHLERMNTDLLDLERVATQEMELHAETVDLPTLATDVAEVVSAGDRPIEVEGAAPPMRVDRALVRRILANLLENALRHTPEDARIGVEIDGDGDRAELTVWDSGPGVADDDKDAIFELFQRATATSDGTGIGLHVVSQFANLHGGRAWVEDREGGGACFRVSVAALPA